MNSSGLSQFFSLRYQKNEKGFYSDAHGPLEQ